MKKPGRAVIRTRYVKDSVGKTRTIENHLRYITFRSREKDDIQQPGLFGKDTDSASIKKILESIKQDKALKHPDTPKIHQMIISFQREDYERYGVDYKELTRHVMEQLEEKKGLNLTWVASAHLKGHHPHVHVVIKSTGTNDKGETKRFRLNYAKKNPDGEKDPDRLDDIEWIKEKIDDYNGRDHYLEQYRIQLEERTAAFQRYKEAIKSVEGSLDGIIRSGEQEQRRARYNLFEQIRREAEREKRQRENRRGR